MRTPRGASLQEGAGDLEVGVVRCDDRDYVAGVLARCFLLGHLTVVVVDALDAQAFGKRSRRVSVPTENACGKYVLVVQPHRVPVSGSVHRTGSSTDHARN